MTNGQRELREKTFFQKRLERLTQRPKLSAASPTYGWFLCVLLFLITVNNYMDRQLLSIVAPTISTEFNLRASDIAVIINAFLLTYGIGQMFSGRFMDWIGPRQGFTLSVLVWSLAGICTSLARNVLGFSFFRFVLGAAESGNFPGGIKVLTEWFPQDKRTTAVGFFTSGVSIGAVLTPPAAAYLTVHYGWRTAFVAVGVPGLLWILAWRFFYKPAPRPIDTDHEQPNAEQTADKHTHATEFRRWSVLLRQRLAWAVILVRFIEEPVGWLFYSWLPLYLNRFMGVTLMNTGLLLMIPFFTQDVGFILGGWLASHLLKRGWSIDRTRKSMVFLSGACMLSAAVSIFAPTPLVFVLLISVATFGHGSWSSNVMSIPGDVVPYEAVGTLYGLSACGGAVGAMVFTEVIGKLVDAQHSFDTVFVIGGVLPLVAATVMSLVAGKIQPLPILQSVHEPLSNGAFQKSG